MLYWIEPWKQRAMIKVLVLVNTRPAGVLFIGDERYLQ